ncbi:carbohydrate kinase family protein [Patescibacteria group bacterium]|nr:carbohydrate kinase family protein [Patescibacteria group bacterium]
MINNIELLSIGDASLDVFITPTESDTLCQLNDKESFVCFSYGDKIPVKTLEISIGGNAANNAVGARRLGVKAAVVLSLGNDEIGNQIVDKLKSEKVNTTYVVQQPSTSSNYSNIISYAGERTIFTYKAPRSYAFPVQLPGTPWLYLTSMGDSFRPFYNRFVEWLKDNPETKLVFNPGSRQLRAGLDSIREVLSKSYIIYVNRKEAETLTGMESSQGKEKELLSALSGLGPKIPIVTDGGSGSFVFDGQRYLMAGILPVDPYERTGSGDSFGSGCLAALIRGKPLEEALIWGTVNAASVIGYTGSQRGLLRENELEVWLERARSSEVKVKEF